MQRIKKIFTSVMATLILVGTWSPGLGATPNKKAEAYGPTHSLEQIGKFKVNFMSTGLERVGTDGHNGQQSRPNGVLYNPKVNPTKVFKAYLVVSDTRNNMTSTKANYFYYKSSPSSPTITSLSGSGMESKLVAAVGVNDNRFPVSPNVPHYVRAYDVTEKIQQYQGGFYGVTAQCVYPLSADAACGFSLYVLEEDSTAPYSYFGTQIGGNKGYTDVLNTRINASIPHDNTEIEVFGSLLGVQAQQRAGVFFTASTGEVFYKNNFPNPKSPEFGPFDYDACTASTCGRVASQEQSAVIFHEKRNVINKMTYTDFSIATETTSPKPSYYEVNSVGIAYPIGNIATIKKSVVNANGKDYAVKGDTLNYTFEITNNYAGSMVGVVQDLFTDDEFLGATIGTPVVTNVISQAGTNIKSGITLSIASGATANITIPVQLTNGTIIKSGMIDNKATFHVDKDILPEYTVESSASIPYKVHELTLTQISDVGQQNIGKDVNYTIDIKNTGVLPVKNVNFSDEVDQKYSNVTATTSNGTLLSVSSVNKITGNFSDIPVDGSVKVFIKGTIKTNVPVNTVIENVAKISGVEFETTESDKVSVTVLKSLSKPNLIVPPSQTVAFGGSVDTVTGVSATDFEDGNITSRVINDASSVNTSVEGVYTVKYMVTDSDGSTVEQAQIVAVGPYNVVDGATTIIAAKNYTKRVGGVELNDGAVKQSANVHVFDKSTKADITATTDVNVVYGSPTYAKAVGAYPITFIVLTDATAIVGRVATVVAGDKPVLTVPVTQTIAKGAPVDITTGVSATDTEDGDITSRVTNNAASAVNVNVDGIYPVVYTVIDSDGNTVTKVQFVLVGMTEAKCGITTCIVAEDFIKRVSQVEVSDNAVKTAANVRVFDRNTGADITAATPVSVAYGHPGYQAVIGEYTISYKVTSDPSSVVGIKAIVEKGKAPELTVPNLTTLKVGESFNTMAGVNATDPEDGDITSKVVVTEGVVDSSTLGEYVIKYSVTDSDGITKTQKQLVVVGGTATEDLDSILVAYDFTKKVSEVSAEGTDDARLKTNATAKVFDIETKADRTDVIGIFVTSKGGYDDSAGIYPVTFAVASGGSISIKATVEAGNAPVLTVRPSQAITLGGSVDTTTGVSAIDVEEGNITSRVTNDAATAVNTAVEGIYTVTYKLTDSDKNTVEQKQIVTVGPYNVVDGDKTIIVAKNYTKRVGEVVLNDGPVKTSADVHVFDKSTKDDITATTNVNVVYGSPTYAKAVGNYPITFVVSTDTKASVGRVATVVAGDKPVLTVPVNQSIAKGGSVDTTNGVSAIDREDGNITSRVTSNAASVVNVNIEGIYPVVYTVTDSDGNTVTKVQFVTVGNVNPPVVGAKTTIAVQDFTKRVSEVGTTQAEKDASAQAGSRVQVWDSVTGTDITAITPVVMTYGTPAYTNIARVTPYRIIFTVTSEPTTNTTNQATVVSGSAPVLTVPNTTSIPVGGAFDKMGGVSATDTEDGNITSKIVVSGTVNTAVVGEYKLDYTVTDTDGNTVSKSQLVVVGGSVVDNGSKIIVAHNFNKKVSEVLVEGTTDTKAIANAKVKVFDSITKVDETATSTITAAQGGYQAVVGVYPMTFTVGTPIGNIAADIKATVIAGNAPVLTVKPAQAIVLGGSVDTQTGVTAVDVEDGNITMQVTNDAATVVNTAVEGIYTVTYKVTDNDGNTVEQKQIVTVGPYKVVEGDTTIIAARDYTKRVGEVVLNDGAVKTAASVHVFDKSTKADITATTNVNVVYGSPTYAKAVGNYPITFVVSTDTKASVGRVASVVAGDKPVLTTLVATALNVGDSFDPMAGASATDLEDGNLTSKITFTTNVDTTKVGTYKVDYTVTDSDGNTVKTSQLVTVGKSIVVGKDHIIVAQDFTKRTLDVDVDPKTKVASIKTAADLHVFEKGTANDVTSSQPVTTNDAGYTNVAAIYPIEFVLGSDTATKLTIQATVTTPVKPAPPIINSIDSSDKVVEGKAIPGNTITVTFPDGKTATTVVKTSGEWTVDVPKDTKLPKGSEVTAIQADVEHTTSDSTKEVVSDKSAPVLSHPTFTELKLDSNVPITFKPMNKVTAADAGDGDLTNSVNFNSTVVPNVAGLYTVDYDVTDSDGNKTTGKQVVLINDGTYVVDGKYVINAKDFTKRVGEVTGSDAEIKAASDVQVFDITTGQEIKNPTLVITKGGYTNKVGTYNVTLKFNPEITIKAHVIAGNVPTINAPKYTEIKVGEAFDPTKQNDGVTNIVAKDEEDGILGGQNFSITSGVNSKKAGLYQVTYRAADKDGNVTTVKRTVVVNDGTYVTGDKFILHASDFTKEVIEVDTKESAVRNDAKVSVYNKETLEDVTVNEPIVVSIGSYKAVVGQYNDISFTVKNDVKATKDVMATVVDTIAPLAPPINPATSTDKVVTGRGEKGATITVEFADGSTAQAVVDKSGNWSVDVPAGTTLVVGEKITASQKDATGNVSPKSQTTIIDKTAPLAPPIDPIETGDKTITGQGEPGGTITVTFPDGKTAQTVVDAGGKWIVNVPVGTNLPAGSIVKAFEVDKAGNKSEESSKTVTDTKAPLAPVIHDVETTDTEITGKGEAGATVTVTFPDEKTATAVVDKNGNWSVKVPVGTTLPLGKDVTATQSDAQGNTSPEAHTTIIDKTTPDAPVIDPVNTTDKTVGGTGEAGATVTVILPGGKTVETTVDQNGKWTIKVPEGTTLSKDDEIKAFQTDQTGNKSPNTTVLVVGPNAPEIKPPAPIEVFKSITNVTQVTQITHVTNIENVTALPDTGGSESSPFNITQMLMILVGIVLLLIFGLRRKQ